MKSDTPFPESAKVTPFEPRWDKPDGVPTDLYVAINNVLTFEIGGTGKMSDGLLGYNVGFSICRRPAVQAAAFDFHDELYYAIWCSHPTAQWYSKETNDLMKPPGMGPSTFEVTHAPSGANQTHWILMAPNGFYNIAHVFWRPLAPLKPQTTITFSLILRRRSGNQNQIVKWSEPVANFGAGFPLQNRYQAPGFPTIRISPGNPRGLEQVVHGLPPIP